MEADATDDPTDPHPACAVNAARLDFERGDISQSYSADLITDDAPVRKPFQHDGAMWICTGITVSGLTDRGRTEHMAYRIVPERLFTGTPTMYRTKIATGEPVEAARNDPNGFYHGVTVKHRGGTFVLCGPPLRFVTEKIPARPGTEPDAPGPLQLSLF